MLIASSTAQALGIVAALAVQMVCLGFLLCRALNFESEDTLISFAIICGAGAGLFGFAMFALGYCNAWNRETFLISTAVASLILTWQAKHLTALLRGSLQIFKAEWQGHPNKWLWILAAITASISAISCLRPTTGYDERAYHWPAPLMWAAQHHWAVSPYRFMNGPSLIELLYIPGALFQNLTSGHLTNFLIWLILLINCVALARLLQTPLLPVLAAVIACPVVTTQSSVMMNDLGASTFVCSAMVALFTLRASNNKLKTALMASIILSAALSAKAPFALAVLPVMLAYLLVGVPNSARKKPETVAIFLAPLSLIAVLWLAHTYCLIGHPIDLPIQTIWSGTEAQNQACPQNIAPNLAGYPSLKRTGVMLLAPIATWLIGNQEPYGGRTGLIIPIFLAAFMWTSWQNRRTDRNTVHWWLLANSTVYFAGVGMFVIRTRYHMIVWIIWSVLAGVGYSTLRRNLHGKKLTALTATFSLLAALSCADSWRTMLQWQENTSSAHILPQLNCLNL
jgi:hypothetical protein